MSNRQWLDILRTVLTTITNSRLYYFTPSEKTPVKGQKLITDMLKKTKNKCAEKRYTNVKLNKSK